MYSMFSTATALKLSNTLSESYKTIMTTSERLSTGSRLNSSMDGAADVAIASHFDVKSDEIDRYLSNSQESKSFMQVLEADYGAVSDYLNKALEKMESANNELLTKDEILAYVNEAQAMLDGTANVSNSSSYKDIKLMDGSAAQLSFEMGDNTMNVGTDFTQDRDYSGSITVNSGDAKADILTDVATDIATIKSNLDNLNTLRGKLGVKMDRLDSRTDSMLKEQEGYIKTESMIRDTDVAAESAKQIKAQVLYQTSSNLFASMTEGAKSRAISIISSAGIY